MVKCPSCRSHEFALLGRMTRCTTADGQWMLRRIDRKWVLVPGLPAAVEFRCPCGFKWKEMAK